MQKLKNISTRGLRQRWRTIALLVGTATGLTLAPMALAAAPPVGTTVDSPSPGSSSQLTMVNATTGWAFDGKTFLRTTDSGREWTTVTPTGLTVRHDQPSGAPNTVWDFLSAKSAWIAEQPQPPTGTVHLWYTNDGGRQWTEHIHTFSDLTNSPDASLSGIDFLNADQGWMSSGLEVWGTANGGRSWHRGIIAKTAMPTSATTTFTNPATGWAVLPDGGKVASGFFIYRSKDRGLTWHSTSITQVPGLYAMGPPPTFSGQIGLLAVYRSGSNALAALQTSDGGQRWTTISSTVPNALASSDAWGMQTIGGTTAWAVAEGRLWRYKDGAHTWAYRSADRFLAHASGIDFINAQIGWVWKANKNGMAHIWMTTSGGSHWTTWAPAATSP